MKQILSFLALCLISFNVFSQAPQKINYQAVIRDATGAPLKNKSVNLRLSILNGPLGASAYTETQMPTTNEFGLVNLQIGAGTPVLNLFSDIPWSTINKHLKIEADITGGTSFAPIGTVELASVPYALNAVNAEKSGDNRWTFSNNNIVNNNTGNVGIGGPPAESAILDIQSTDKGLLIPRVATTGDVASPADGLLVFQTGSPSGFYYYKATKWIKVNDANDTPESSTSGGGAIIPFSSGLPVTMTTVLGGLNNLPALVGFGNSAQGPHIIGGIIDLTGSDVTNLNYAFVMPRDGKITDMYTQFSSTLALSLVGSTISITAQLYVSNENSNQFSAVPGATITLAPLTGFLAMGTTMFAKAPALNIPVEAGKRYLLVYSAQVMAGLDMTTTIKGYVSAGINIE